MLKDRCDELEDPVTAPIIHQAAEVLATSSAVAEHVNRAEIPAAVATLVQLEEQTDRLAVLLVATMRRDGATWGQIGDAFGVSRQAVTKRFQHAAAEVADTLADDDRGHLQE